MNVVPSPELSYLTGVMFGDGFVYHRPTQSVCGGAVSRITLAAKSREFVEAFNRCACKLKGREKLHPIHKRKNQPYPDLFYVNIPSKALYDLFKERNLTKFKPIIEEFSAEFIRGIFDSEGSVSFKYRYKKSLWRSYRVLDKRVIIINTNLQLLKYVRELLEKFSINSTIVINHKKGTRIFGGKCLTKKTCYQLGIWDKLGILKFIEKIGATIPEKMDRFKTLASLLESARSCATSPCRRWTNKETKFLAREYKRLSIYKIAEKLGRTKDAIRVKANYGLGIYRRGPYRTAHQALGKLEGR